MKKLIIWLLSIVIIATMVLTGVACKETAETAEETVEEESAEKIKLKVGFGFSYGTHPVVQVYIKGAMDGLLDQRWVDAGYEVEVATADGGWEDVDAKMVNVFEDIYAQNVDGLLVFTGGCGYPPGTPIKELFNKNGIPVALMEYIAYIEDVDYVCWAGPDFYASGAMAAETTAGLIEKGSEVIAIATISTDPSGMLITDGYRDTMEEAGMVVFEPMRAESATAELGKKLSEDALAANPDLKAIFTSAPTIAQGVLQTLREQNKIDEVVLVSQFCDNIIYQALQDGEINACMMADIYNVGFKPAEGLMMHLTGQTVLQKDTPLAPILLTIDNFEDFADDPSVQPPE